MSSQELRLRDPKKRINDFDEVFLGYTKNQAILEAKRCLQCKQARCVLGCPVNIDIPKFIKSIADEDFESAYKIILEKNNLPAVCGRVCPQETQCEAKCVLNAKNMPINIGKLERFVADYAREHKLLHKIEQNSVKRAKKVAVIGSGPSSLTCAADCARLGFDVTMFESLHKSGGVLRYGIPEFRLPDCVLDAEVEYVKSLGVKIEYNVVVGITYSIDDLKQNGFEAVFIGTGAGLPYFLNIEGESLGGIYSSNEFLTRVNLMKAYMFPKYDTPVHVGKKAVVIGGGNVAMDSARTLLRLGVKDVTLLYRRTREEMPARLEEVLHAEEEGVKFNFLVSPIRFLGDESSVVKAIECQVMQLSEMDESGRRRPVAVFGETFSLDVDTVVVAVGQGANPLLIEHFSELAVDKHKHILVDENMRTNIPGVFAGGDIVTGADTVISAMGAGKKAAKSILEYLSI